MDKHDNKINLEEMVDRQLKRLHELDTTSVLIKSMLLLHYLLHYLFYNIQF